MFYMMCFGNLLATVRTTEISTIVTKSTIRTNWSLECWNKFRVAIKTFQTGNPDNLQN
jgi:hypothetical protein